MLKELRDDDKLKGMDKPCFRNIFLIDDFTASGKSFIRFGDKDQKFHGKLGKIIDELCAENIEPTEEEKAEGRKEELHLSYLLDAHQPELHIDILFCMATHKAEENIRKSLDDFLDKRGYNHVKYHIHIVQVLEDNLSTGITDDPVLMKVLEKPQYLHQDLKKDKAYNVGSTVKPFWASTSVPCLWCSPTTRLTIPCPSCGRIPTMIKNLKDCFPVSVVIN